LDFQSVKELSTKQIPSGNNQSLVLWARIFTVFMIKFLLIKMKMNKSDKKRGLLHIKNPFLKLMEWIGNAQKGKSVCKS